MAIKKVSRETISRLYCISIRLKWNSQRGPSNVKIVTRDYPRSKKRMHWLMIAKILLHIEKNPSKEKYRQQVLLIQKTAGGSGGGGTHSPMKLCNFYHNLLSLQALFPVLKLTYSCHIHMNIIFLQILNLIINWHPLFYKHAMPERLTQKSDKIWKQRDFHNHPVCMKSFI